MPESVHQGLPFEEAIAYHRGKVKIPTERWTDLWEGMHAKGFMVAGANKDGLLTDFYTAIDKAISQGTTLADFQKDFDDIVARHGWSYNGERGWRSNVIYDTNLTQAYNAGRYQQMTDPDVLKARPYWQYRHGDSVNPRPEHLAWNGLTLKADDPWWDSHYPQNGWGCKCSIFALSPADLEREGKDGPDEAPEIKYREWTDKATGQTHQIPEGIDPGFAYNPGQAAYGRPQALRLMDTQGRWQDLGNKGPADYGRPLKLSAVTSAIKPGKPATGEASLRAALTAAIGGEVAHYTDPTGAVVEVNQAICDHIMENPEKRLDGREAWFPFIPELITDPYEVWVGFAQNDATGQVAIRRRYVKAISAGKDRVIGLWAEFQDGQWASGDFFRGGLTGAGNLRKGRLLYGKD